MALNLSGPISLNGSTVGQSIGLELGKSSTAAVSLNDTDLRTLAGVLSGAISMSAFYGKSSVTLPGQDWEVVRTGSGYTAVTWTGSQYVLAGFLVLATSLDGITWTLRSKDATWFWTGIAWSGSMFVVVGNSGFIKSSTDGITWTTRTSGTSNNLRGVTWSGTQFLAVGNSGTALTSPDGITWTSRFTGVVGSIAAAAWDGSKFTAVGAYTVLTSPDGASWTTGSFGDSPNMYCVVWAGSQYVAAGDSGVIKTSPNGTTWTSRTSGTSSRIDCLGWSGSTLMYGTNAGEVRTSTDGGINWVSRTTNTTSGIAGVVWDGSKFVAVGAVGQVLFSNSTADVFTIVVSPDGLDDVTYFPTLSTFLAVGNLGRVISSFDGVSWQILSQPLSTINGIATSSSTIVIVSDSGQIRTSSDGVNWTSRSSGTTNTLNSVVWNGSQFVIAGNVGTILTSPDGSTWTTRSSGTTNGINKIAWSGSQFVAVSATGGILTSTDGATWTSRVTAEAMVSSTYSSLQNTHMAVGSFATILTSSNAVNWSAATGIKSITTSNLLGVTTDGSTFVVVGAGGFIATSTDGGGSWTSRSSGTFLNLQSVIWTGSQYVIVGQGGIILTSPTGATWTTRTSGTTLTLEKVVWTGSQYVAVGQGGAVLTSPDSATWTTRTFGATTSISGLAWSSTLSLLVAVASFGAVRTSTDGVTWTSRTSGTTNTLYAAAWSGSRFVIAGDNGALRVSTDGFSWSDTTPVVTTSFRHVNWTGSQFVAVGNNGNIHTSTDGITWTTIFDNVALYSSVWSGTQFMVGGSAGRLYTSPNALTWTSRTTGVGDVINTLSSSPDLTVLASANSLIRTSPDGITWTDRPKVGTSAALVNSAWSGSQFVVVGNAGAIVKSGTAAGAFTATVTPSVSSVNEGGSITFNIVTDGLSTGTAYWTLSGAATAADINTGLSSGSFSVSGSSGSVNLTILADNLTEGSETLQLQVRANSTFGPVVGTSSTVTINDTSLSPTATVTPTTTFVNEGSSVTFNVSTSGFANGTLYWTISGTASAGDFTTGTSGSFTVSSSSGSVLATTLADSSTEGSETFQLQVRTGSTSGPIIGTSASVTISDTSVTPSATVTPSTSSVDEGGIVTFNVSTSGFPTGTLYWTITGTATAADFSPAVDTGSFNISSSSGSVNLTILADTLTEGSQTFQLQVRTGSTSGNIIGTSSSVTINDTSLSPAGSAAWSANLVAQNSAAHGVTTAGPINNYYRRYVFIVTYESFEIQTALGKSSATITGLRFNVVSAPTNQPLPSYAIGMKLTTNSANTNNSGTAGGTFTLVRAQASESFTSNTTKEFTLSTPFNWNAGQNLVISFAWGQVPVNYTSTGTVPTGLGTSFFNRVDTAGTYAITDAAASSVAYRPVIQLYG